MVVGVVRAWEEAEEERVGVERWRGEWPGERSIVEFLRLGFRD